MSAGFQREQRYQVFKAKDLEKLPPGTILALGHAVEDVLDELKELGIPRREYVVVESDWPEYELVWQMIEARMDPERKSLTPAESVAHWRERYLHQKDAADNWWKQVLVLTDRVGEARALAKERSLRIDHLTVALMEYQQAPTAIDDSQDRNVEHLRSEITRLQNQVERERSAFIAANLVRDPTNRMVNAEEWTPLDRAQAVITFAKACGFAKADLIIWDPECPENGFPSMEESLEDCDEGLPQERTIGIDLHDQSTWVRHRTAAGNAVRLHVPSTDDPHPPTRNCECPTCLEAIPENIDETPRRTTSGEETPHA